MMNTTRTSLSRSSSIVLVCIISILLLLTSPVFASDKQKDISLTADNSIPSVVTLNWNQIDDASGYQVFTSTEKTSAKAFKCIATIRSKSKATYECKVPSKSNKRVRIYKVRSYKNLNGERHYSKFSNLVYGSKPAEQIPVITYHRLCKDSKHHLITQSRSLFVKEGDFNLQMEYLDENGYRTISTDEFRRWYSGRIVLPEKTVLITFDDGNYSVVKYGMPILKKYKQKATIFAMGISTKDVTDRSRYSSDSYYCIGKDVMKEVQEEYPDLEFQSHTWALHNSINGEKPVYCLTEEQLYEDAVKQYNEFGYTSLAYPWGETSENMIKALQREGHIKIAFAYGDDDYAKRTDNRYYISRIKISGTESFDEFAKWFTKQ